MRFECAKRPRFPGKKTNSGLLASTFSFFPTTSQIAFAKVSACPRDDQRSNHCDSAARTGRYLFFFDSHF